MSHTILTETQIAKVAHLARLQLTPEETHSFLEKLANILDMIAQIQTIDTTNIAPMAHPFPSLVQRLREDEVTEPNVREQMMAIAPAAAAGLYLVPQVIAEG